MRERERIRKWGKEHPEKLKEYNRKQNVRRGRSVNTDGRIWDVIKGDVDGESFEYGWDDRLKFEEDITFASWYAERHKYE